LVDKIGYNIGMINLVISGRFPQKERFHQFGCNVVNHFFKRDRKELIVIGIEMKPRLDNNDSGYCVDYGTCDVGDFGEKTRARMIAISLSRNYDDGEEKFPYAVRDIASTLAHELVHAKQYIRRELTPKILNNALTTSRGKARTLSENKYRNFPWEEEAYGLEEELTQLYW